uniref:Uncharacterized protein n=1 Tax=Arundo donax TaxID=35708 RepID=A0A0A8ZQ75_ARUDO
MKQRTPTETVMRAPSMGLDQQVRFYRGCILEIESPIDQLCRVYKGRIDVGKMN